MLKIGLTGGICCGKSLVCRILEEYGDVDVLSADEAVKDLCRPGGAAYAGIVKEFGKDIVQSSGDIDRRRLANIVFNDPQKLNTLEAIIHPLVRHYLEDEMQRLKSDYIVVEIPLLYESHFESIVDVVVVVACSEDTQIERCMKRDQLSEEEVRQRMLRQMPLRDKVARADFVIDNNLDIEETRRQIGNLWPKIKMGRARA